MKKSLLALAALTAFAGAASAQSSVTLFGILDAGVARISGGGKSVTGMENSGYNSSRLGFRGTEDLGGGLQAKFWLEGQLFNDTGEGFGTGQAMNWQRQTWVGLAGGFGEVRLGRDYTGNFVNVSAYDAFGTNGVGTSMGFGMVGAAGNGVAAVRASNSVSYALPAMGGVEMKAMYSFGENVSGGAKTNNHWNIRAGYAAGPIAAHVAYAKTEGATDAADVKYMSFGASFNTGMVVPMLVVAQEKTGAGLKVQAIIPAAHINIGSGTIRLSYGRYDIKDSSNDWNKIAAGYIHNMSKRTALYGTYARISNKGTQNKTIGTNGVGGVTASAGGNSSGFEFGIRHSF
ncbi:MAG: porin [Rubrivivax sp.]